MKRKPKQKGSIIAALDIGSSKIACFIARIVDEDGQYEILGVGHQASQGVRAGAITELDTAEAAIRRAVHAAENMAANTIKGYPLREVVINVPGVHAKSFNSAIEVGIAGQDVTDGDIDRALAEAQERALEDDRELIHTIPAGYTIDSHNGIKEPRGMYGETLDVNVHLVTGDSGALRNFATCAERSHLDINALCVSSYAAGLSSLVEDEMDLGCTVIDIGGGVTSMAVFQGGSMIYCDAVPLGGRNITSDIARGLTTSINDAERLKTLYGSAVGTSSDQNEMIDVPLLGENDREHPNHVPRALLVGIIQPRIEEILELARARLNDSGPGAAAGRRVVLTGGSSQLPGMRELAQLVLDKQVRLGRPVSVRGLADAAAGPAFSTTAGLLNYVAERQDEIPAEIFAHVEPGNMFERVKYWLRENW